MSGCMNCDFWILLKKRMHLLLIDVWSILIAPSACCEDVDGWSSADCHVRVVGGTNMPLAEVCTPLNNIRCRLPQSPVLIQCLLVTLSCHHNWVCAAESYDLCCGDATFAFLYRHVSVTTLHIAFLWINNSAIFQTFALPHCYIGRITPSSCHQPPQYPQYGLCRQLSKWPLWHTSVTNKSDAQLHNSGFGSTGECSLCNVLVHIVQGDFFNCHPHDRKTSNKVNMIPTLYGGNSPHWAKIANFGSSRHPWYFRVSVGIWTSIC